MPKHRMATPSRSKGPSQPSGGMRVMAKRTSSPGKGSFNFKNGFFSIALWGLGLINVILIISFVSKHFLSGAEHPMSSEAAIEALPAENLKIEVLNGCGVAGLARKYADLLKSHGFDPVNVSNYEGSSNVPRTYIYDRRSKDMASGLRIAKILGLPEEYVAYQESAERLVAATLILGADYKQIPANPK